jgi:hypothetical protein
MPEKPGPAFCGGSAPGQPLKELFSKKFLENPKKLSNLLRK